MIDDGKVCMHCKFFDGFDSTCNAHPPVFAGYRDEDGEQVREFVQPAIESCWAESCGEWQASDPDKSLEERRREIHCAAVEDVPPVEEPVANYELVEELVKARREAINVLRGVDEFLTNRIENLSESVPLPTSQEEFKKQRRACYAVSRQELRDLLIKHGVSINKELLK